MNLVEMFIRVEPRLYSETRRIEYLIFKAGIVKEEKIHYRLDAHEFGHNMNRTVIRKDKIGIIQDEEPFNIRLHNIQKWIYVLEDENYNEEELKQKLIQNVLDELDNRRKLLDAMESLVRSIEEVKGNVYTNISEIY